MRCFSPWLPWRRRSHSAGMPFSALRVRSGPAGAVLGFAASLRISPGAGAGVEPRQHRGGRGVHLVLSMAYLRTRALWVSWGINFGWKATRALMFGLAVSGVSSHSPVVQGDPMGPFWLTGGRFRPGRKLAGVFRDSGRHSRGVQDHARARFQVQRAGDCAGRDPGGSGRGGTPPARSRDGGSRMGAVEPAPPPLVQIGQIGPAAPIQNVRSEAVYPGNHRRMCLHGPRSLFQATNRSRATPSKYKALRRDAGSLFTFCCGRVNSNLSLALDSAGCLRNAGTSHGRVPC